METLRQEVLDFLNERASDYDEGFKGALRDALVCVANGHVLDFFTDYIYTRDASIAYVKYEDEILEILTAIEYNDFDFKTHLGYLPLIVTIKQERLCDAIAQIVYDLEDEIFKAE